MLPFVLVSNRAPQELTQVLFPFFFRYRNTSCHRIACLPWFYYGKNLQNGDRRLVLSPLLVDDNHLER